MALKQQHKQQPKRISTQQGEVLRQRAQRLAKSSVGEQLIDGVCRLLFGAVLAAAEMFNGCTPFGLAFVAASGSGLGGFSALCGCIIGTMLQRGFADGLRYAAAAILIFSISFAFYDMKFYSRSFFMPLAAAAINGATGFIYRSAAGWTSTNLIYFLTEMFFTGAACYFYRIAFGGENAVKGVDGPLKQRLSFLLLFATALIALANVSLFADISLGRTIGAVLVMICALKGGVAAGSCVGLGFGLAMDFACGSSGFYTMAFGMAGLVSGLFHRQGKAAVALVYLLTSSVAVLWTWSSQVHVHLIYEVFLALISYFLVPRAVFDFMETLLAPQEAPTSRFLSRSETAQGAPPGELERRLTAASAAFQTLYRSMQSTMSTRKRVNQSDVARVFDRAAEKSCQSCPLRGRCWEEQYQTSFNACNDALPAILRRGEAQAEDFAPHFSSACMHFPQFLAAVNEQLTALLQQRQYENRLRENRQVMVQQYGEMCGLLENLAAPVQVDEPTQHRPRVPMAASMGIACRKREGERHSGDAGSCFKTAQGVLYVLLCDGMGSGEAAQQESALAVELLEQFLQAGVTAPVALRTIATAFALRAEEGCGFTTIDLLEVDLYTGKSAIYKYGAAPSYLRRNTRIMAVTGGNLPAGASLTEPSNPDITRFTLGIGDCVLLLSDGVADGQSEADLKEALRTYNQKSDPKSFVSRLLEDTNSGDDKSALLVTMVEPEQKNKQRGEEAEGHALKAVSEG